MPTVIPAEEIKRRLDELLDRVANGEVVILETAGRPRAVVVANSVYEELRQLREEVGRRRAFEERFAARRDQTLAEPAASGQRIAEVKPKAKQRAK